MKSIYFYEEGIHTAIEILKFYKKIINFLNSSPYGKEYNERLLKMNKNDLFNAEFLKNFTIIIFESYNFYFFEIIFNYLFLNERKEEKNNSDNSNINTLRYEYINILLYQMY